jgi:hypothetical protein
MMPVAVCRPRLPPLLCVLVLSACPRAARVHVATHAALPGDGRDDCAQRVCGDTAEPVGKDKPPIRRISACTTTLISSQRKLAIFAAGCRHGRERKAG